MPSVLIIEDDPDMQTLERMALEYDGYSVATARDGAEGLRCLRESQPCLILLDLMMPGMDGLTFLLERRRQGLAPGVPVVCVTAAGAEMVRRAEALGISACLGKPTDFAALSELVSQLCGRAD